ncbi:cyclic nucleotide-binding domain-containing protein [Alkalibaculum sp. M08DMB]|uniref:Cyclic nucleotide-binding domain-containing protein n=1 Tax=Alkalibaculum sporogenes TaxID=2655001 RepID=A0A6A7K7R3_9FIRM|nr:Crp/Fnr family transcriptional regulator [Alkalibaculum sporogenes]MPW25247.1 cyclic nucleotide-binding domain-containing protein [Alkalibaculum sporogenes]
MTKSVPCMKDLDLFSPLNEVEKQNITRLAQGKMYKKGEFIFRDGDPADTIFLICTGNVLLQKNSSEGKQISIDILTEGAIIGENTIFENLTYKFEALALEDSYICRCFKSDFVELLKNPEISIKMMKSLSEKVNNYTDSIVTNAFYDVKSRVFRTLVKLSKNHGQSKNNGILLEIFLSHEDLAHLSNASRVMVTKSIATLRNEGKISIKERRYMIHSTSEE